MPRKKKFSLFEAILTVICVVFVAEAAPIVAGIGNQQYFWWIFLIITFLLPYGLFAAELSTTYQDEGGLYDWVKRAFGKRWGARVSWYYWINFPLWMASLGLLFPATINLLTQKTDEAGDIISEGIVGTWEGVGIALVFIWIVTFISFLHASESKWILNLSAVLKILLALSLVVLSVMVLSEKGMVNDMSFSTFAPDLSLAGLGSISIILFNFMGFEVMAGYTQDMDHPKRQLPTAIIAGGIAIAAIYVLCSFGIGVAIPYDEISKAGGLVEAVQILSGNPTGLVVIVVAILFLITLFGNMISWSYGVNYVADYAAKNGDMPKFFSIESKKNGMPIGASIANGIFASAVVIISGFMSGEASDIFWSFFGLSVITLLFSYIPMFPALLKLRKSDPSVERPYKVPGGPVMLRLMCWIPVLLLI
ncbi:MAG: APC family permease, partial [Bifidobacteriaceae bacterium]|nr:APC family permease [Bifidobacteriaceae bacterium]